MRDYFTYFDVECAIKDLANVMDSNNYMPKTLVAICRGGLFPTLLLSEMLACRDIKCISIQSYDNDVRKELKLLNETNIEDNEETLFVDDLYDSGQTMEFIDSKYPNSKKAVVYSKVNDINPAVDYVGNWLDTKNWLVFPWEEI